MSTAVNEILKQAERLPTGQQIELAAKLMERVWRDAEATQRNGSQVEESTEEAPQTGAEEVAREEDEVEERLDVFSLKHPPPKWTYTAQAQFYYAGRGKPSRYDFSDIFNDEEEDKEE